MNKKIINAISAFLFLFFSINCYSQTATINLQIFTPLPQIDLGSVIIQNNLTGIPKVFYVQISPAGRNVYVHGTISWNNNDGKGFRQVFDFTTAKFVSKSFYSDELGTAGIRIASSNSNSDVTKEILDKGKPTGTYRFQLQLLDETMHQLSQASQDVSFSNPSQTLTMISPEINSIQPVGNIIARWNQINGAQSFKIKLNVRTSPAQGLEDALNSGTPLINDKIIDGATTNIDLRTLLEREWLPGQELVLRVSAVIGGIGGGSELNSNLINFTIANSNQAPVENIKNALIALLNQLQSDKAKQFVSYLNGVSMDNVKFYNNEGNEISFAQFQSTVSSILNSIVKIKLTNQ